MVHTVDASNNTRYAVEAFLALSAEGREEIKGRGRIGEEVLIPAYYLPYETTVLYAVRASPFRALPPKND